MISTYQMCNYVSQILNLHYIHTLSGFSKIKSKANDRFNWQYTEHYTHVNYTFLEIHVIIQQYKIQNLNYEYESMGENTMEIIYEYYNRYFPSKK